MARASVDRTFVDTGKVQTALKKRIEKLKTAQITRADVIHKALNLFEKKHKGLGINSANDYIALSEHQQRLIGSGITHLEISGNADMEIQIISNAEKKAKERLKRLSK